jgi:hypothetical protein
VIWDEDLTRDDLSAAIGVYRVVIWGLAIWGVAVAIGVFW